MLYTYRNQLIPDQAGGDNQPDQGLCTTKSGRRGVYTDRTAYLCDWVRILVAKTAWFYVVADNVYTVCWIERRLRWCTACSGPWLLIIIMGQSKHSF